MPDENIFNEEVSTTATPATTVETTTPAPDATNDLLAQIKGEDGMQKYKDVATALNALQHSQDYIKQLKQELEDARTKASQGVTMEQVLEALKRPETPPTAPPTAISNGLTADDVVRILQEKETKEKQKANAASVAKRFKEVHGDKAEDAFYSKAAEMGLSREAINQLASTSPEAVFSMFGMVGKAASVAAPAGINTSGVQSASTEPRSTVMGFKSDKDLMSYWTNLKADVSTKLGTNN